MWQGRVAGPPPERNVFGNSKVKVGLTLGMLLGGVQRMGCLWLLAPRPHQGQDHAGKGTLEVVTGMLLGELWGPASGDWACVNGPGVGCVPKCV